MIKMIICDLDGTLLTEKNEISIKDKQAVNMALQQGIDFCLASGRKDIDIKAVANMLGSKFHRISQNGGFIYTVEEKQLHETTFPPEVAIELYERIKKENLITFLSTIDKEYVEERTEHIIKIEERLFSPVLEEKNLLNKIGKTIFPSKLILNGTEEQICKLHKELTEQYPNVMDAYISESKILDIVPKNISKGNAILILLDHLDINQEEIACIGDSFNDIPMFQLTEHSFAMATAHQDVKKAATHVVETVADAIYELIGVKTDQ
ncbi:HAD family hydrolase [Bacillus sp. Marseille-P3661]|uniref:HAD family hydrolase n=1 Tax=Bacillus sp. Marseille-P3661 TaxID=1936234 RepID=UPI000C8497D1|nr:HAD family hydrolase [Bacillus sp. Marseille-P3661]